MDEVDWNSGGVANLSHEFTQVKESSVCSQHHPVEVLTVLRDVAAYIVIGLLLAFLFWLKLRVIYGPHIQVRITTIILIF